MKLFVLLLVVALVAGAPSRSKSDNKVLTTYDQKQTGDYNIQLHLKDFQIVALIGDDTLGAFGDYEYNYDYSDLTIKPHNSTTAKPAELPSSSSPSTTTTTTSELPTKFSSSTPVPSTTTQKLPETSSYSSSLPPQPIVVNSSKTVRSDNSVVLSAVAPSSTTTTTTTERIQKITSVTIVPQKLVADSNSGNSVSNVLNLGEILHYKKCPSGYSKDKRGRCRRTRRPGVIPYGITRFASNLAAKFRHAVSDEDEAKEETSKE